MGPLSAFDLDANGNPTTTVLTPSDVYTFQYNPRQHQVGFDNLGVEKELIDGSIRVVKQANSSHKKRFSISQRLMTDAKKQEFETKIVDSDEYLVIVDDGSNIYKGNLTGITISRRATTAARPVSWFYSMTFVEA